MNDKKSDALFSEVSCVQIRLTAYPELRFNRDRGNAPEIVFGVRTETYLGMVLYFSNMNTTYAIAHKLNMRDHYEEELDFVQRSGEFKNWSYSETYQYIYLYEPYGRHCDALVPQLNRLIAKLGW